MPSRPVLMLSAWVCVCAGGRWGCGEPVLSPNLTGDKATFLQPQIPLPIQAHQAMHLLHT